MPFEKGNKYGSRSKRGQAKITKEIKERLSLLEDEVFETLKKGIKTGEFQYIKLWFNYYYGLPKQRTDINITKEEPIYREYEIEHIFETDDETLNSIYDENRE